MIDYGLLITDYLVKAKNQSKINNQIEKIQNFDYTQWPFLA